MNVFVQDTDCVGLNPITKKLFQTPSPEAPSPMASSPKAPSPKAPSSLMSFSQLAYTSVTKITGSSKGRKKTVISSEGIRRHRRIALPRVRTQRKYLFKMLTNLYN